MLLRKHNMLLAGGWNETWMEKTKRKNELLEEMKKRVDKKPHFYGLFWLQVFFFGSENK